jgi:anti-sigma B factor antagonist
MSAPLQITQRSAGGVTILELNGRLVFDEGDRMFKERVAAVVAAGHRDLVIDLRNVTYMDSGGVGSLVGMYLHVVRRGGQLKLLCPSARSCRVLRITHLITVFEVFEDEERAVASFATPDRRPDTDPHSVAG